MNLYSILFDMVTRLFFYKCNRTLFSTPHVSSSLTCPVGAARRNPRVDTCAQRSTREVMPWKNTHGFLELVLSICFSTALSKRAFMLEWSFKLTCFPKVLFFIIIYLPFSSAAHHAQTTPPLASSSQTTRYI